MPTVQETIQLPGDDPTGFTVTVELIANTERPAVGFRTTNNVAVQGKYQPTVASDGDWTVDLYGNDDIEPAETVYRVTTRGPKWGPTVRHISVPTSGGPYEVSDLLSDVPEDLTPGYTLSSAYNAHVAEITGGIGFTETWNVADGNTLPSGWTDAYSLAPTEFSPLGITKRRVNIYDPTSVGYPASAPAIGAAWQDFGSGYADDIEATITWSGVFPIEATPLIHVVTTEATLGIGCWPFHDLLGTGPTLALGTIGNPPDNFALIAGGASTAGYTHRNGTPRKLSLRSTDGNLYVYLEDPDSGRMVLMIGPVAVPSAHVGATKHGVAVDAHYATPSYPPAATVNPVPYATTPAIVGPFTLRNIGDYLESGIATVGHVGAARRSHEEDPSAHSDLASLFLAHQVFA